MLYLTFLVFSPPNNLAFSTVQQLLLMFNNILSTSNQNDVVYLDFKKAFDCVLHKELPLKLRSIGISGGHWLWFESYLERKTNWKLIT